MYSTSYEKYVFIDFGLSQYKHFQQGYKESQSFKGTYFYCSQQTKSIFFENNKKFVDAYYNYCFCMTKTLQMIKKNLEALDYLDLNRHYMQQSHFFQHQNQENNHIFNNNDQKANFSSERQLQSQNYNIFASSITNKQLKQKVNNYSRFKQNDIKNCEDKEFIKLAYNIFSKQYQSVQKYFQVKVNFQKNNILKVVQLFLEIETIKLHKNRIFIKFFETNIHFIYFLDGSQSHFKQDKSKRQKTNICHSDDIKSLLQLQIQQMEESYLRKNKLMIKQLNLQYQNLIEYKINLFDEQDNEGLLHFQYIGQKFNKKLETNAQIDIYYIMNDYIKFLFDFFIQKALEVDQNLKQSKFFDIVNRFHLILQKNCLCQKQIPTFSKIDSIQVIIEGLKQALQLVRLQLSREQLFDKYLQIYGVQKYFIQVFSDLKMLYLKFEIFKEQLQLQIIEQYRTIKLLFHNLDRTILFFERFTFPQPFLSCDVKIVTYQAQILFSIEFLFEYHFYSLLFDLVNYVKQQNLARMYEIIQKFKQFIQEFNNKKCILLHLVQFVEKYQVCECEQNVGYIMLQKNIKKVMYNSLCLDGGVFIQKFSQFLQERFKQQCDAQIVLQKALQLQIFILTFEKKNNKILFGSIQIKNLTEQILFQTSYKAFLLNGHLFKPMFMIKIRLEQRQKQYYQDQELFCSFLICYYQDLLLIYQKLGYPSQKAKSIEQKLQQMYKNNHLKFQPVMKQSQLNNFSFNQQSNIWFNVLIKNAIHKSNKSFHISDKTVQISDKSIKSDEDQLKEQDDLIKLQNELLVQINKWNQKEIIVQKLLLDQIGMAVGNRLLNIYIYRRQFCKLWSFILFIGQRIFGFHYQAKILMNNYWSLYVLPLSRIVHQTDVKNYQQKENEQINKDVINEKQSLQQISNEYYSKSLLEALFQFTKQLLQSKLLSKINSQFIKSALKQLNPLNTKFIIINKSHSQEKINYSFQQQRIKLTESNQQKILNLSINTSGFCSFYFNHYFSRYQTIINKLTNFIIKNHQQHKILQILIILIKSIILTYLKYIKPFKQ